MSKLNRPHRRYNLLTGEWVLVSPQLQPESVPKTASKNKLPDYDEDCLFCKRKLGLEVFADESAPLAKKLESIDEKFHPLLKVESISGVCRTICYSAKHNQTFAEMDLEELSAIVNLWSQQAGELGEDYLWVQIYEDRSLHHCCENTHPHCHIWASDFLPTIIEKENQAQQQYWHDEGVILLQDYIELEMQQEKRVIIFDNYWVAVIPFWAAWPFEVLLVPRRHVHNLPELTEIERASLASVLKRVMVRYVALFGDDFPYIMAWHGAPYNKTKVNHWQLHAHIYAPILPMFVNAGYKLAAETQRSLTPEKAAEWLRGSRSC